MIMKIDNILSKTRGRFATVETSHRGTFSAKVGSVTPKYVTLTVPTQNVTMKIAKDKITRISCGQASYTR